MRMHRFIMLRPSPLVGMRQAIRANALAPISFPRSIAPALGVGLSPLVVDGQRTASMTTKATRSLYSSLFQNHQSLLQRRQFSATSADDDSTKESRLEKGKSKVKVLWEKYGIVFLGFYGGLYLVTLGSVYEIVALKHVDAQSVVAYLHSIGVDKFMDLTPIATSKAGNLALAWVLTKFTEPLRLAFTVSITPSLARFLGYAPPKASKRAQDGTAVEAEGATGISSSSKVSEVDESKSKV